VKFKIIADALSRVARKGCMAVVKQAGEERAVIFDPEPEPVGYSRILFPPLAPFCSHGPG